MGLKVVANAERRKIIKMKREGFSLKEISLFLNRSQSTVARYAIGITVLPQFHHAWQSKRGGSAKRAENRRKEADALALNITKKINARDLLLIAACLYWGEGSKREFSFSNTDPHLIETFLQCLISLGVKRDRLKIGIRIYEDINQSEAKRYWAKVTGIKPKSITSVSVLPGKKLGKLPYGMCRIRLAKGNDYFNLLMATIRLISKDLAPIAQGTEQWTPKP